MNQRISRDEKHKTQTKKRLVHGEDENTSAPINISQEDGSNIFE